MILTIVDIGLIAAVVLYFLSYYAKSIFLKYCSGIVGIITGLDLAINGYNADTSLTVMMLAGLVIFVGVGVMIEAAYQQLK